MALTAVALSVVGCSSAPGGGAEQDGCVAEGPPLVLDATFAGRDGVYRLTLVAASPDGALATAEGTLWLEETEADARVWPGASRDRDPTTAVPLYGWTDVQVASVQARAPGRLDSRDPERPGVLVLEQRRDPERPPSVTLRFGSLANDRDRTAFDAGYLALRVAWMDESGAFGGGWSSGVRAVEAKGHFCAVPEP